MPARIVTLLSAAALLLTGYQATPAPAAAHPETATPTRAGAATAPTPPTAPTAPNWPGPVAGVTSEPLARGSSGNGRLAFTLIRDTSLLPYDIFTIRPDGTDLRRMTRNNMSYGPVWSPDGTQIAYQQDVPDSSVTKLKVMNADGTHKRWLRTIGRPWTVAWAPDGQHLTYTEYTDQAGADLWQLDVNTREKEPLVVAPYDQYGPVWSPSGDMLAYTSTNSSGVGGQVFVYSVADAQTTQLTFGDEYDGPYAGEPAWSPDGKAVVCSRYFDFEDGTMYLGFDVESVPLSGGPPRVLAKAKYDEEYPSYQPQGGAIVYSRGDHGGYRDDELAYGVSLMRPDGSQKIVLSKTGEAFPAWSPDGRLLAVIRPDWTGVKAPGVYVMRADGSHLRRVAAGTVVWGGATWQPLPE